MVGRPNLTTKPYKYAKYHAEFRDCPPVKYAPIDREGYRFVFDEEGDQARNFSPVLIMDEKSTGRGHRKECRGYGLSFFDSQENATVKFAALKNSIPQIHKRLGRFVARVGITEEHGVACEPSKGSGHFTVHEFADAVWKWQIVAKLV